MGSWIEWLEHKQDLLPGQQFLSSSSSVPGLNSTDYKRVAIPFGLAGRLLKEGQSVALAIDHFGQSERRSLAYFLHSLHLDACQGLISGKWVSEVRNNQTRHLVVWGPNREWDLCLEPGSSQLHPLHLKKSTKEILEIDSNVLRTMLISRRARKKSTMDELKSMLSPFCFVIDATPWGYRKDFSADWDVLNSYFPDIPKIVIYSRSDLATSQELSNYPLHHVIWRKSDDKSKLYTNGPKVELLVVPDKLADKFLGTSTKQILEAVKDRRNEDKEIVQIARSLVNQLSDMATPFEFYQRSLSLQKGAAAYMQKTPLVRLDLLEKTNSKYGAGSVLRSELAGQLKAYIQKLEKGNSGKVSAVKEIIEDTLRKDESILVVTRTENDARTLMQHVLETIDSVNLFTEGFQCISANKRWPASAWNLPYDKLLITCNLFYSDLWLLDIPHLQTQWMCYPYEVSIRQNLCQVLYKRSYALSDIEGDKLKVINYQWPRGYYLKDWKTTYENIPEVQETELSAHRGTYSVERSESDFEFAWDSDAAFDRLFEEDEAELQDISRSGETEALTVITWEEDERPFVVTPKTKVKVIDESSDSLEDVYCFNLEPGDKAVLMLNDNRIVADIFNALSDQLASDMTIGMILRQIDVWQQLMDSVSQNYSVKDIRANLSKNGISISENQVRNWINHKVHGPEKSESIKAIASLCDNKSATKSSKNIFNAMQVYRTWRRSLGKFIRKTLRDGYARENIKIEGLVVSPEIIEELLVVRTVRDVVSPPPEWKDKKAGCLEDLVPKIEDQLSERLILTPRSKTSMKASPFNDVETAFKLFQLMSEELFEVYTKKKRLDVAIKKFSELSIAYKGDSSDGTKGKYSNDYSVRFNGKIYDAGKHLAIGTSRDPKFILRVYFDWDEKDQKIIIIHAGRHLPTRKG